SEGRGHEVARRRHPAVRSRQGDRPDHAQAAPRGRLPVVRRTEQVRRPCGRAFVNRRFSLDNQIAVVTGASGKLGAVWTEALIEAGARVAALDLGGAVPTRSVGWVTKRGGVAIQCSDCDIPSRASIERAAGLVAERMGEPSILVNNAGIDQPPDSPGGRYHLHQLPIDEFRRMVEVNLLGTFQVTQVFGERMASRGGGSSINLRSPFRA